MSDEEIHAICNLFIGLLAGYGFTMFYYEVLV